MKASGSSPKHYQREKKKNHWVVKSSLNSMDNNTYILVMRKENKMLIHPRFNRCISRMKQIQELWDLLRKPWYALDRSGRISPEPAFDCNSATCIRITHCSCHGPSTLCSAMCHKCCVRYHKGGWYGRHPRNTLMVWEGLRAFSVQLRKVLGRNNL